MRLSVVMMVKDEEENLDRCLSSIQNIMKQIDSELIIVDTGSKDKTVEIAKRYTEKVYHHPWNNNFSEMRNISIGFATGEWLFILDADEEVNDDRGIIGFLKSKTESKKFNTLCIALRNFTFKGNENAYSDILSARFFRNDGTFHYESAVHNIPIFKEPVGSVEGIIYHYGYASDDPVVMEKKFLRTVTLLNEVLEKDPNNIYYRYQFSVSLAMYQNWDEAEVEAMKAFRLIAERSDSEKDAYFYLYGHLMMLYKHLEKYEEIIRLANEAVRIRENDMDVNFFVADAFISLGSRTEAIPYLSKYLELVRKYENQDLHMRLDIKIETIAFKLKGMYNLMFICFENRDYQKVLEIYTAYLDFVIQDNLNAKLLTLVVRAAVAQNSMEYLATLYRGAASEFAVLIEQQVEREALYLDETERKRIIKVFKNIKNDYGRINRIRNLFLEERCDLDAVQAQLSTLENPPKTYYADVVFEYYYRRENIIGFMNWVRSNRLCDSIEMIDHIHHMRSHFEDWLLEYLAERKTNDLETLTFRNTAVKYLLKSYVYEGRQSLAAELFDLYVREKSDQLRHIYRIGVVEDESKWAEIEDDGNRMVLYMERAMQLAPYEAFGYMRRALPLAKDLKPYVVDKIQQIKDAIER